METANKIFIRYTVFFVLFVSVISTLTLTSLKLQLEEKRFFSFQRARYANTLRIVLNSTSSNEITQHQNEDHNTKLAQVNSNYNYNISDTSGGLVSEVLASETTTNEAQEPNNISEPIKKVITITARGNHSDGVYPEMQLLVNGLVNESFVVNQNQQTYTYIHESPEPVNFVTIKYTNDKGSRNLYVDNISVDGTVYETESHYVYSVGVWNSQTNSCQEGGFMQSEKLTCNGYFHFSL